MGQQGLATLTFFASLCMVPAVLYCIWQPSTLSFWVLMGVILVATALWFLEQMLVSKLPVRSQGPALLVRGFIASTCAMWVCYLVVIGLIASAFGYVHMAGSGMLPTLGPDERLIYRKKVDPSVIQPGAIVVYKNAADSGWGQPGWIIISRILAGPGDTISMRDGIYLVNGSPGPHVALTGRSAVVLDIPSAPESLTVPEDCFFVVQDSPSRSFDSQVLSWARRENLLGSQLWHVGRRGFFKAVE